MEFNISLKFWIERPCGCRGEKAALGLTFEFNVLSFHFLDLVFLLEQTLARIATWSWYGRSSGLLSMEGGKFSLSGSKGTDVSLPTLCIERLGLIWVFLRSWIIVTIKQ